jgi:hypothetical protein
MYIAVYRKNPIDSLAPATGIIAISIIIAGASP